MRKTTSLILISTICLCLLSGCNIDDTLMPDQQTRQSKELDFISPYEYAESEAQEKIILEATSSPHRSVDNKAIFTFNKSIVKDYGNEQFTYVSGSAYQDFFYYSASIDFEGYFKLSEHRKEGDTWTWDDDSLNIEYTITPREENLIGVWRYSSKYKSKNFTIEIIAVDSESIEFIFLEKVESLHSQSMSLASYSNYNSVNKGAYSMEIALPQNEGESLKVTLGATIYTLDKQ